MPGESGPEGNPFLMSEEDQAEALAERNSEEAARAEAVRVARESGEPMPVVREARPIDPDTMTDHAKVKAMRNSQMTDEQINQYFDKEDPK